MRLTHHVGVLAMLAALTVPATTANAGQDPRRAQVATQYGYDEGYRQGLRVGEDHGRRGLQFNFGVAVEYRQGDYGWRPSYGSHDQYRVDFRLGFERGYRLAYDQQRGYRNGAPSWSNGRGRGNSDLAFSNGFNDGYREGLNDGRRRHRNDPYAESLYRSGNHGFQGWYGSREEYRWHYRDAFRSGYERGFADAWHR
ncbi:MAG TPA: hypothetical protein VJN96_05600 [Vicinamibacterales bacterium]|nr:hypothetical protein [Vicinamibacterales bacterium]